MPFTNHEITSLSPISNFSTTLINEEISPRFKDLKSAGTSFLPSERNTRLLNNLSLAKPNHNYNTGENALNTLFTLNESGSSGNLQEIFFTNSNIQWINSNILSRLINNSTIAPISHTPLSITNTSNYPLSFDKFLYNEDDLTPNLLKSKEESAPAHIFNTY